MSNPSSVLLLLCNTSCRLPDICCRKSFHCECYNHFHFCRKSAHLNLQVSLRSLDACRHMCNVDAYMKCLKHLQQDGAAQTAQAVLMVRNCHHP